MSFAYKNEFLPDYTYNDYCNWEGRWELIEGVPYAMSPMPTGKHQWLCGALYFAFMEQLKNCKKCKASLPMDWKIGEKTVLQPDLFVACFDFKNKKYITEAPILVTEVLSPSTRKKDVSVKKEIYNQQGVKYFIVIEPNDNSYIIYELSGNDYTVAKSGHEGSFTFELDECEAEINFSTIFPS